MKLKKIGRKRLGRRVAGQVIGNDEPVSEEWSKEIKSRIRDLEDPIRYMVVSEFSRGFVLYYNVSTDTFAMHEPSGGTLFKRRETAESVKKLLGGGAAVVKFTTDSGRYKRLSPYRGRFEKGHKKPV